MHLLSRTHGAIHCVLVVCFSTAGLGKALFVSADDCQGEETRCTLVVGPTPLPIGNVSVLDPFHLITAVWSIYSDSNNATMCSGKPSLSIISMEMLINSLGITVHLNIAASASCFSRIVHRFMVQSCGL